LRHQNYDVILATYKNRRARSLTLPVSGRARGAQNGCSPECRICARAQGVHCSFSAIPPPSPPRLFHSKRGFVSVSELEAYVFRRVNGSTSRGWSHRESSKQSLDASRSTARVICQEGVSDFCVPELFYYDAHPASPSGCPCPSKSTLPIRFDRRHSLSGSLSSRSSKRS
jgi:hypothetical protein